MFGYRRFLGRLLWEFVDGIVTDASRNVLTCRLAKDFITAGTNYTNNGNGGVSADIGNYMSRPQGEVIQDLHHKRLQVQVVLISVILFI